MPSKFKFYSPAIHEFNLTALTYFDISGQLTNPKRYTSQTPDVAEVSESKLEMSMG